MSVILNGIFFLLAALITFSRGAGPAFALVYLPALLLFSRALKLSIPGLPDITPAGAAIYGILLAGLLAGRRPRLRATAVDYIVGLLLCAYAISAVMSVGLYHGISVLGAMGMQFGFIPYFTVRCALQKQPPPRHALILLVATIFVICVVALIEVRLWPETYLNFLHALGLRDPSEWSMVLRRFGLFRASASFIHPIDLGMSGALVFALIAMVAWRLRIALNNVWVLGGLALALIASFCGISFGPFMGFGCALFLYLLLIRFPRWRRLLPAAVTLMILVGFAIAAHLATTPIDEPAREEAEISGSLRNRQELMQLSWGWAKTAGFFGWGTYLPEEIDRSVDSAYLLITMQRGWVALGLWLVLPVCLTALAYRGVRSAHSRRQVQIILAGTSAIVGTMIAMFAVWFGFVYAQLFMIVLALTVNESQAAIHAAQRSKKRIAAAQPVRRPVHALLR